VWVVGIQFISRNLFVTFVFVWAGAQCFILSAGAGRTSVRLLYARRSAGVFPFSGCCADAHLLIFLFECAIFNC
jgi:hypothetical protein